MGAIAEVPSRTLESALPSSAEGLTSDIPCTTTADCKLKGVIANRCNYGREALQASYNSFNTVAHTMAVAISELCRCTFTQGRADCALENVPSVCIFPYNVYSKMFAGSVQLWEAVKADVYDSRKWCNLVLKRAGHDVPNSVCTKV